MKKVLSSLLVVLSFVLISSTAFADYGNPSGLPDWSAYSGYTQQFWGLHAVDITTENPEGEPFQALAPDNFSNNSYGTASATWVTGSAVGWSESIPGGSQPTWVEGIYGGNVIFDSSGNGPFSIDITVPTGSIAGTLKVAVQYDWYDRTSSTYPTTPSLVIPSVAGATFVSNSNEVLAHYTTLLKKDWVRTTAIFEFTNNPGTVAVKLGIDGFSPIIDSFSVTTAVVPEPATLSILALGVLGLLSKKRA
ncbi:MAG: PEP-CTERM sorting domain-containing protein [Phycisphaerae bacterium]|jgi:hypothetical protein